MTKKTRSKSKAEIVTPVTPAASSVVAQFVDKVKGIEDAAARRYLPKDVSARDLRVIVAVSEVGKEGMAALVKRLGVAQPTVSISIVRLEGRGLVDRLGVEGDLRRRTYALTARGRQIEAARRQAISETEALVLHTIPKAERPKFELTLSGIIAALP